MKTNATLDAKKKVEVTPLSKKDRIKLEKSLVYLSQQKSIVPVVGMGASHGAGSDSYPSTIIEVSPTLDYVVIQDDEYKYDKKVQGEFVYFPDLSAPKVKYTLRKNGTYIPDGTPLKHYWSALEIGARVYYRNPSF